MQSKKYKKLNELFQLFFNKLSMLEKCIYYYDFKFTFLPAWYEKSLYIFDFEF